MAKSVGTKKEKKAQTPDFKDSLYEIIGQSLANALNLDVMRLKIESTPECLLLTNDAGNDYTISITLKKNNVDYDDDHIKTLFTPKAETTEESEE